MKKGALTHQTVLDSAMDFVCRYGLLSMTIGEIAKQMNMSRTGIISHFKNKQDMQIALLRHCEAVFIKEVLQPSQSPDPVIYLTNVMRRWPNWVFRVKGVTKLSCPFVKAVAEYQERPACPVRDVIVEQQQKTLMFIESLITQAIAQGRFRQDLNAKQLAYVLYSLYLGHNISKHLLDDSEADRRHLQQVNVHLEEALAEEFR